MKIEVEKINSIKTGTIRGGQVFLEIDIETIYHSEERMFYDLWEYLGDEVIEKLLRGEGKKIVDV